MRKVLMRANMSPLDNPDFFQLAEDNLIGNNAGNMLFARAVCRTIMTEDTQVNTIRTGGKRALWSDKDIERFNSEYDCFVIPLANAFRTSFCDELNSISDLVEKLTIPCVVIGVGLQAPLEGNNQEYKFDPDVKRFMNCILDKSSMVGVRGERTANYLERLGYTREKDFTVIGCPSMYLHGASLPYFEKKELTADSSISVNCKPKLPAKLHQFMEKNIALLNNYQYVPQILDEFYAMYIGKQLSSEKYPNLPDYYPKDFSSPIYTEGHGIGFLNASSWLNYLQQKDFSFGSRIHGNIAAIISGTPCFIITSDARIQELAEYHYIPHIPYTQLTDDVTIFDLYDQADYSDMFKYHKSKFQYFVDFLNLNGVHHIYETCDSVEKSPFDKKLDEIQFHEPVEAFSVVSPEEQVDRLNRYYAYRDKMEEKLSAKNRKIRKQQNSRAVQSVLKARSALAKTGLLGKSKSSTN